MTYKGYKGLEVQNKHIIQPLGDCYQLEGKEKLTVQALFNNVSLEDRLGVYKHMAKLHGVNKSPSKAVLQRFEWILGALNSVDWEPISVRSIYYRVVSLYAQPKTQSFYSDIQRAVALIRDYGVLHFDFVSDGSRSMFALEGYESPDAFLKEVSSSYRKNLWADSNYRVIVVVEKQAMIDILYPVCQEYGISLTASKGFNSKTGWYEVVKKHNKYQSTADNNIITAVLMLTDLDSAGLTMREAGRKAMLQHGMHGKIIVDRVGLTEAQVSEMQLPTRDDKISKTLRACELDAMTPTQARALLRNELKAYVDEDAFTIAKTIEEEERKGLQLLTFG